ncbi:hypothetical protein LCGC14_2659340 [marine sediment metagenome]|uniref:Polysaccharide biosynthesis protein CapD-like domain-containing protein n=1 Tax=marine sediment metagenome TaxID=412755 RepID=A0A0F9AER7_9ZZZZ
MIEKILKTFKNKSICVFGGTGTVGSIIVEYLREFTPKVIRIFSNDENSLWESQQKWSNDGLRYLLGDIRNYNRVKRALKGIDYVFNCAAIKHVPFAEYNPLEAVETNILGLDNIINASVECGVKKILHISTDKAVEPTTVMGATKMISERLLQMRWTQNSETDMVCVRFGNVYGSRGSIVQIIRECKKRGEPITITDPNMTRYFMQEDEVIELLFNAFANGCKGEIWVPKLKPVLLSEIIKKEVGINYSYKIIGARKAEKFSEKLLFDHEILETIDNDKYWIVPNEYRK